MTTKTPSPEEDKAMTNDAINKEMLQDPCNICGKPGYTIINNAKPAPKITPEVRERMIADGGVMTRLVMERLSISLRLITGKKKYKQHNNFPSDGEWGAVLH